MRVTMPRATNGRWRRLSPVLFVLLGFAAGLFASQIASHSRRGGGFRERAGRAERGDRREPSRDRDRSDRFRERLVERLDLDEDQTTRLDAFLEANRAEASAFWDDTWARYHELRLRFREQIREILTEPQREDFDAWMQRHERDGRRRSPGPEGATP